MIKVLLLFLCGLLISCTSSVKKEEFIRTVKCDTVKAVNHTVEQSILPGRVKAALETNVAFRVAGQITRMNVVQGQFIRKGTVIAQLDDRDYQTQLSATQAEYNRIKSEADRVIALYNKQSATPNDYDKAVYGLKQIAAKLEAHRNALNDTRLVAPYDCYIEKLYFNMGETVNIGTAVLSIISSNQPEIEIHIPGSDFAKQAEYKYATATINAFAGEILELKLIGINQKANLNQLYTARFKINGTRLPSPGMSAMVSIYYKTNETVIMQIPVTALVENKVWIFDGEKVSRKNVEVVTIKNNGVAWVKGLTDGEVVISGGVNSLKEGQRVKALPQTSKTNEGGVL